MEHENVEILSSSGEVLPGRAAFRRWTSKEAFWRGFRRSGKVVGILVLLPLPFAFLEPFAFMVWGSIAILAAFAVVGPYLHMKFWGESTSFFYVEGQCPYCQIEGRLKPYLSTHYQEKFTVLCKSCGQTSSVRRISPGK